MTTKTHATRQKKLYKMHLDVTSLQNKFQDEEGSFNRRRREYSMFICRPYREATVADSWPLGCKIVGFQDYGKAQDSLNVQPEVL